MRNPAFNALVAEILELHEKKNADYASDDDPLSNFRRAQKLGVNPFTGILVRMSDKWGRLEELARGKSPQNESMRDTLIDLSVYSLLAVILLDEAAK